MRNFSHRTSDYEHNPAYKAFRSFLDCYLLDRDYEKTLSYIEDDFYSLGTGGDEVASDKAEFASLLRSELDAIPTPIEYRIRSVHGKEIADNIWNILAGLDVFLTNAGTKKYVYTTRFTGCFRLQDNGFSLVCMHISEPSHITTEKEFLPLKYVNNMDSEARSQAEQVIFDILIKAMPGGIVSGYAEDGFPLYFVNEQYLELLGYSSYEEYYQDANGLAVTHIHPDDADKVNKEAMRSYSADTQYGIEYRIRHKDGHYIPVYDIGKKMITPDNKEIIICVLYDMTEDAKLKEILIKESSYDTLTGLFNRGGGIRTIEEAMKYAEAYSFSFIDIDNLKLLNDTYSHAAGDHALKHLSGLLMKYFKDNAILARLGGDEFVAFLKETANREQLESLFANIEQEYCTFIEQHYPDSRSSVSIGCVTGTKQRSFEALCQKADHSMYDIKKTGKRGYKIISLD